MFKRVGVDMGAGGRLSPIFPGSYFRFVTMPCHFDPELYYRYTYGDALQSIRGKHHKNPTATPLEKLGKGDVLVFYAGFRPEGGWGKQLIGIFAYIFIERLFFVSHKDSIAREFPNSKTNDFQKMGGSHREYQVFLREFRGWNPHADPENASWSKKVDHIFVCGNERRSRMLSKVEILTEINKDGKYRLSGKVASRWGLKPDDHTRNMPRSVEESAVEKVWTRLQRLQ
jgi:hypothetical protein